jgi:hypothetical protein
MPEINYFAVVVSGVAAMVIGSLWYGPLFGKLWMKGMGWDPSDKELMVKMMKASGLSYLQMFIGVLIMAFVFAHVLWAFAIASPDVEGVSAGLQGGLWMWLGLVVPVKYADKLWMRKPFKYVSIDLGYYLVVLLIMGVILSCWK